MKWPKIKYHPQMTTFDLVEKLNNAPDKNWVNLKCGETLVNKYIIVIKNN